jgi:hypothetical protein
LSASQHGGVSVTLTSLEPEIALLSVGSGEVGTESIVIPYANGEINKTFYVHGLEDTVDTATIVASANLYFSPDTNTVDVVAPGISILSLASTFDTLDPTENFVVRVGVPHSSLDYVTDPQSVRPGSAGVLATVTSSEPNIALVVTAADTGGTLNITIPGGQQQTPSTVAGGGVGLDGIDPGVSLISASADGFISMTNAVDHPVTVTAPTLTTSVTDVGSGLQTNQRTGFLSASGHPGVTVRVTSLDTTLALVSSQQGTPGTGYVDVPVAPGSTSFHYFVHGLENATGTTALAVDAMFFAPDTSVTFDIVQPGVKISALSGSIDALDPPDNFVVLLGKPSSTNADISSVNEQEVRAGSPGVLVTITTADSLVSQLVTQSTLGGTATLLIPANQSRSPSTVNGGGVAFDGLDAGSSVVEAAAPGFITVGTGAQTVFITNQNLYLLGLPADVGSGLQTGALTAKLGVTSHPLLTLRIESADTLRARISTVSGVAGDPFIEVSVPNGEDEVNYFVHGQAGTTGPVLLTATAMGYASAADTIHVVTPMVAFTSLVDSLSTSDPADEFIVQIGVPNLAGTAIATPQVAGSGNSLNVTLTSSNAAVGWFQTTSLMGDTLVMQIAAGESQTQGTVAAGGVAFVPLGAGITTVSPSIPGFIALEKDVKVTSPPTGVDTPDAFRLALGQNYPNPFNPSTTIRFTLPEAGPVSLVIYDVAGRRVAELVNESMARGTTEVRWNGVNDRGASVGTGVYFYRLTTNTGTITRKMLLLK